MPLVRCSNFTNCVYGNLAYCTAGVGAAKESLFLVGGKDSTIIINDTALLKHVKKSVGVKCQHCGVLDRDCRWRIGTKMFGAVFTGVGIWIAEGLLASHWRHFPYRMACMQGAL